MSDPRTPQIRPCPWCGGPAEIDDPEAYKRHIGFRIECDHCNASMWNFAGETPRELVDKWNTRQGQ